MVFFLPLLLSFLPGVIGFRHDILSCFKSSISSTLSFLPLCRLYFSKMPHFPSLYPPYWWKVQNHNELCDPNSFENCSDVDKSADFVWDLLSCPVLVFVPWICKTSSIYWSVQSVAWYITFLGKKRYLCIDIVDTYKFRCSHLYSCRVLVSLRMFATAFEMKWCEALSM